MTVSAPTRPRTITQSTGTSGRSSQPALRSPDVLDEATRPRQALQLEPISAQWQRALDAAAHALNAAGGSLPASYLRQRRLQLTEERHETETQLARLAEAAGTRSRPWLSPTPVDNTMLGLDAAARACLFDFEGVLTDSAALHAWAWGEVFDDLLLRVAAKTGWHFIPFDRVADYREYLDGRPRLEGIHAFLDSRGIRLPEGRPDGPADADTACGVATRKAEALRRALRRRGVSASPGAHRYLEAAARAGLKRAVISASAHTGPMLELADLAALIDDQLDVTAMRAEGLRSRPACDVLLAGCRRLGVRADQAVTLTHSAAGVVAGHAAGVAVIGVADGAQAEILGRLGAERVVPSLAALLDPRIADGREA